MIRELAAVSEERLSAQVCLVGAGAAGIALAIELARSGLRVIVLESGGRALDARAQDLYRSEVVALRHGGVHDLRFRVFGGSTIRWAGQAMPMLDIDFAAREWVPGSGWPIDRDALEPYYHRAASLLQVPAFGRNFDRWPDALPPCPPFQPAIATAVWSVFGPRPDFAERYGATLAAADRVEVLLGANVLELLTDPGATAVLAARVAGLEGKRMTVEADYFVLCAGGIETPRILLASDRTADGGLGNSHDLVGRFFQDHPSFVLGPLHPRASGGLRAFRPVKRSGVKYLTRIVSARELQARERLLHTGMSVVFDFGQSPAIDAGRRLVQAMRSQELRRDAPTAARAILRDPAPLLRAGWRHYVRHQPALDTSVAPIVGVGCEQLPNPESRVTLAEDRDELGMRRTRLAWKLTEHELRSCARFTELMAGEFERLGIGSIEAAGIPDDPTAISGIVMDNGHHMGTTRMADCAADGVVDSDCKVFGLDNLYVASCSVFPTSGVSNPTFTMLALCLRIGDTLKRRARAGRAV